MKKISILCACMLLLFVTSCMHPKTLLQERLKKVEELIDEKNINAAVQECQTLLRYDPYFKEAGYMMGKAYFAGGQYHAAIQKLKSITDDPGAEKKYWILLIESYGKTLAYTKALDICNKGLQHFPFDEEISLLTIHHSINLKDYVQAENLLQNVRNKESLRFLKEMIHYYRSKEETGTAVPFYLKTIEKYPESNKYFTYCMILGKYYFTISDMDSSLKYFDLASRKDKGSIEALLFKGAILWEMTRKKEAEKCFFDAYKINPANSAASSAYRGTKKDFEVVLSKTYNAMRSLYDGNHFE